MDVIIFHALFTEINLLQGDTAPLNLASTAISNGQITNANRMLTIVTTKAKGQVDIYAKTAFIIWIL